MNLANVYAGRSHTVLVRAMYALKASTWFVVVSGFFEPLFYLLSFGLGLGGLVGKVTGASK